MVRTRSTWVGLTAAAFALSACGGPKWADAPPAPEHVSLGAFTFTIPRDIVWRQAPAKPRDGMSEHRFEGRADGAAIYMTVRAAGPYVAIGNTDDLIADLAFNDTLQPFRTAQAAQFRPASRSVALCAEAQDEGLLQPNLDAGVRDAPSALALRVRLICVDPRTTTTRVEVTAWTFAAGQAFSAAQRSAVEAAPAGLAYRGR